MIATTLFQAISYPVLHRAQWQSRKELEVAQWGRFKRLLEHAYARSPFYRRRFAEVGITPETIRARSDLERIPITTREDLRNPKELFCEGFDTEDLHCSLTTNSTGRRTRSYFDDRAWVLAKALLKLRARMTTGVGPTDRIALLQERDSASKTSSLRERVFRLRPFPIDQPTPVLLQELRQFRPTVLYGFPSQLRRLADEGVSDLRISRIYTSGEILVAGVQRQIESAFSAPVLDVFGCTEVKEIAWQCDERAGYHINSDWLLVEVLQDESPDGPVLVTSLYNRAMPLLRYQVGDTGVMLDHPCDCGRGLSPMRPTGGRTVDYFALTDGTSVSPYAMTYALEQVRGVRQFQLIQTATNRVTARIGPAQERRAEIPEEVRACLANILPGVAIKVRLTKSIGPEESGKYKVVFSRLGEVE